MDESVLNPLDCTDLQNDDEKFVRYNEDEAAKTGEDETIQVDYKDDIEKMFELENETNGQCSKNDIEIKNNIFNIKSNENAICDDEYDIGF